MHVIERDRHAFTTNTLIILISSSFAYYHLPIEKWLSNLNGSTYFRRLKCTVNASPCYMTLVASSEREGYPRGVVYFQK